jgi:hypothetical protein
LKPGIEHAIMTRGHQETSVADQYTIR